MNKLVEEIRKYVKSWMQSQDTDKAFIPDENGYVMFRRGVVSINLAHYFEMLIQDYLEENASQKEDSGLRMYEITFGQGLKTKIEVRESDIKILTAIDGWGIDVLEEDVSIIFLGPKTKQPANHNGEANEMVEEECDTPYGEVLSTIRTPVEEPSALDQLEKWAESKLNKVESILYSRAMNELLDKIKEIKQ